MAEWFVEYVAFLAIDVHVLHALLAALHGIAQGSHGRVGMFERLCEDGLAGNLRGVGMYEVGTATAYHDAVGVRIGLDL